MPCGSTRCPRWPSPSSTCSTPSAPSRCASRTRPTAGGSSGCPTTSRWSTRPGRSTRSCPAGRPRSPNPPSPVTCPPPPTITWRSSRSRWACRSGCSASGPAATSTSSSSRRRAVRVCVIGSGGREHALAHVLGRSADVVVTPGNPGIPGSVATPPEAISADLYVVGPGAPLVEGLADRLRASGGLVFGPGADGARLEGSKAWMKGLLDAAGVPTARYGSFADEASALDFLRSLPGPWVVKTDGLAAGKGVLVTTSLDEAVDDVGAKLRGDAFGDAGLMLTAEGPKLLEYNVRFGDPEAQVVLPRLTTDLAELLAAAAGGDLGAAAAPAFDDDACVTVVLAAEGYPAAPRRGDVIAGIAAAESAGATVFCAGVGRGEGGRLVTAGGRVLDVTACGSTVSEARTRAYAAASHISWDGMFHRFDIALQASRESEAPST